MNSKFNETQQLPKPPSLQNRLPKATATTEAEWRSLHSKTPSLYDLKVSWNLGKKGIIFPAEGTALTHYAVRCGFGAGREEDGQFSPGHLVLWGRAGPQYLIPVRA